MARSLTTQKFGVATFTILVGGKALPQTFAVKSIQTDANINKISSAKIVLIDGGVATDTKFQAGDSTSFEPGKVIEIKAGYESTERSIFKGIVIKHGLQIKKGARGGAPELVIECKHKAIKLTGVRKNEVYSKKKDSEIITKILSGGGVKKTVDATSYKNPELIQYYTTDWDFMLLRADANGLIVIPDADKLSVIKPKLSGSPAIEIEYGSSLYELQVEIDASNQYAKSIAYSWDVAQQKLIKGTGSAPSSRLGGNWSAAKIRKVVNEKPYIQATPINIPMTYLDTWAAARLVKSTMAFFQGKVSFQGYAALKVGDMVKLKGLSKRFNGNMFVGGITHIIENGKWITEVKIGHNEDWYHEMAENYANPTASGIISPIKGLTVAKVTKIDGDPDGNFRIQIKIPTLQKDSAPIWARMTTFYASAKSGAFFTPDVGDEVIIGFLNEDPQAPIILGSVYNKKDKKSPLTPEKKNQFKAIVTKTKLKLTFDDKDKIITIETPGKNKITLNDKAGSVNIEDKNKNSIKMSSSGINIKSNKDIVLDGMNVKINAKVKIEGAGKAGVALKGAKVEIKGDAMASVQGAMVEVKGSGMTTIKGGIVMIN